MWIILGASIFSLGVFLERLVFYHKNSAPIDPFLDAISGLIRKKRYQEALERCDEAYGPAVRVIQAAILKRHLPKTELREVVQEVAQMQVPRLEANLPILATVGYICPLLGLLGTVTGMIAAFVSIEQAGGSVPVGEMAKGIWEALITTAAGLVVAIPTYVAYNFLVSRVQTIITDMERSGIEIVQVLVGPDAPATNSSAEQMESSPAEAQEAKALKAEPKAKKEEEKKGAASKPENKER